MEQASEVEVAPDRLDLSQKRHPEMAAGGYAQDNGTVEFYQRVVSILPEGGVVLDLGAGRGALFDRKGGEWRAWLVRLGKKYSRRIGVDVDPAVKTNPELSQAEIIEPAKPLPFPDQTFDLVLCDWVLEHIEDPKSFIAEVRRVLKVGGWLCARTPNHLSYFSVGVRLLSGMAETKALRFLQPGRRDEDVFPKFYRMNSLGKVREQLPKDQWINATYTHNPGPSYHGNVPFLYDLLSLYQKLTPRSLATVILIFARRTT